MNVSLVKKTSHNTMHMLIIR